MDTADPVTATPVTATPVAAGTPAHPGTGAAPPPRWLEGVEREAWLRLIGVIIRLPAALDTQLQRDSGLSHFEYTVMVNLSNTPGHVLRMSRLAGLCHSSLSRLSHVVARLERRGWVRRDPCPDDGRATLAQLTDAGFATLAAAAPGHVDAVRDYVIDALDRDELAALTAIGDTILRRLDGDTGPRPGAHSRP